MSLRSNKRSAVDVCPWSSVALTLKRQLPSGSAVPAQVKRYVPGARCPASIGTVTFPGPTRLACTALGRTTLYEKDCVSATRSAFGDKTGAATGAAKTPVYATRSASATARSPLRSDGLFSSCPSNATLDESPLSSADAVTQPSCIIASANSKLVIPTL